MKQSSSSKSTNVISQPRSFADIDMVTAKSGYAITKDFHVVKTQDGGNNWSDVTTFKNQLDFFYYPALVAVGDKTVYAAFNMASGIVFEKSIDSGKHWTKSTIKVQTDDWNSGCGGSLILSFINESDGFLLTSATPACGLMSKALYKTSDGGNSWTFVGKSADPKLTVGGLTGIHGYTTGMAFGGKNDGYITCTFHGQNEISVYKTTDSGKNWSTASLPLPEKYASLTYADGYHVDAYSPDFFGTNNKSTKMELLFCHEDERYVYIYSSNDGGTTWHIDGISSMLMQSCCFVDNKNGLGLNNDGTLYVTKDGGITWHEAS